MKSNNTLQIVKEYFVYILQCSDGTFYTGIARDVSRRLRQHNGEISGGAKYTSKRRPVLLKYSEIQETRSLAMKRELKIKAFSRDQKQKLFT
jgi:putative endonuclease